MTDGLKTKMKKYTTTRLPIFLKMYNFQFLIKCITHILHTVIYTLI